MNPVGKLLRKISKKSTMQNSLRHPRNDALAITPQ
jgi:hypothetical protein